jgi:hypothetical protein
MVEGTERAETAWVDPERGPRGVGFDHVPGWEAQSQAGDADRERGAENPGCLEALLEFR